MKKKLAWPLRPRLIHLVERVTKKLELKLKGGTSVNNCVKRKKAKAEFI